MSGFRRFLLPFVWVVLSCSKSSVEVPVTLGISSLSAPTKDAITRFVVFAQPIPVQGSSGLVFPSTCLGTNSVTNISCLTKACGFDAKASAKLKPELPFDGTVSFPDGNSVLMKVCGLDEAGSVKAAGKTTITNSSASAEQTIDLSETDLAPCTTAGEFPQICP